MASRASTHTNGRVNGGSNLEGVPHLRFSGFPTSLNVPVGQDEEVEIDLRQLPDDPEELCSLLETEGAKKNIWMTIASAYAKQEKVDVAIEILNRGLQVLTRVAPKDRAPLSTLQCWLYLGKSREAPRTETDGTQAGTKAGLLNQATSALNDASRINPSFPPLVMARGVLSLLRASLAAPVKASAPHQAESGERIESLRQALRCFEDASKMSGQRNILAIMGKARVQFALGKYADSLASYQDALARAPDVHEPDPRIGIGCCLWLLNHPEEAREAWERALEINPVSKIAHVLLGLYHLRDSSKHDPLSPEFAMAYRKGMSQYVQKAYQLDSNYPLTSVTLGGYFLPKLAMRTVEELARKAVDFGDAFSVVSDGWYLLARKEHYRQDTANRMVSSRHWQGVNIVSTVSHLHRDLARERSDYAKQPAHALAAEAKMTKRENVSHGRLSSNRKLGGHWCSDEPSAEYWLALRPAGQLGPTWRGKSLQEGCSRA